MSSGLTAFSMWFSLWRSFNWWLQTIPVTHNYRYVRTLVGPLVPVFCCTVSFLFSCQCGLLEFFFFFTMQFWLNYSVSDCISLYSLSDVYPEVLHHMLWLVLWCWKSSQGFLPQPRAIPHCTQTPRWAPPPTPSTDVWTFRASPGRTWGNFQSEIIWIKKVSWLIQFSPLPESFLLMLWDSVHCSSSVRRASCSHASKGQSATNSSTSFGNENSGNTLCLEEVPEAANVITVYV